MKQVLSAIHINIPFTMLKASYLDIFISNGLNPEIGIDATAMDTCTVDEFKAVARLLKQRHLKISLHGPFKDLSPASQDLKIRSITQQRLETLLSIVPLFNPITVVCHPGYDWKRYGYDQDEWLEQSVNIWQWFAEELSTHDTRLMLENVYEEQPEDLLKLFERLAPKQVGFCLDTGHQAAFSRTPLDQWLAVLGPYLQQCHLHDNHGEFDDHLALGQGTIDFKVLFDYLLANRSSPPVITVEPHGEESLWPSVRFLEEHWPFFDNSKA